MRVLQLQKLDGNVFSSIPGAKRHKDILSRISPGDPIQERVRAVWHLDRWWRQPAASQLPLSLFLCLSLSSFSWLGHPLLLCSTSALPHLKFHIARTPSFVTFAASRALKRHWELQKWLHERHPFFAPQIDLGFWTGDVIYIGNYCTISSFRCLHGWEEVPGEPKTSVADRDPFICLHGLNRGIGLRWSKSWRYL